MSKLSAAVVLSLLMTCIGCRPLPPDEASIRNKLLSKDFDAKPKFRIGSYASDTVSTHFLDTDHLGPHGYGFSLSEHNGIVYTCKAGHIDTFHVREMADWTGLLAAKTYKHLKRGDRRFSFKMKEGSPCYVQLTYPNLWDNLSPQDKEFLTYDLSISLGQYFTYRAATWHEILTWFGYKCTGFFPEFPSAFSWEDTFSNLLGCKIGAQALRDRENTFSEAVTLLLNKDLEELIPQPAEVGKRASDTVKGLWYSGAVPGFVNMKKRNFDIGLDDGLVTPCVVPSVPECGCIRAQSYPVPNLDIVESYGFSVRFEIEPREWEGWKILSIVYPDKENRKKRLQPALHFAAIMDYIKKDAESRYGPDCACPDN
jgi:hypothetical protein